MTGYLVYGSVDGFTPIFGDQGAITFTGPTCSSGSPSGVLAGFTARAYAGSFYGAVDLTKRILLLRG